MKTKATDLGYLNPSLGLAGSPETPTAPRKDKMARRKGSGPASFKCPSCGTIHSRAVLDEHLYICPQCKHHLSMPSQARIATLAGGWAVWDFGRALCFLAPR